MTRLPLTPLFLIASLLLAGCASTTKNDDSKTATSAKLHYRIGLNALYSNDLPKAFDELMTSDSLNPNQPQVLDALAFAWRLRGDLNKSEELYKKALRYGGGSSTHTNYGSLLIQLGRYKEAEKELRTALADPRYGQQYIAYVNLGDALAGQKRYDEAVTIYRQAYRIDPRSNDARLREADVYIAQGRVNYARALYQTMLRENPDDRTTLESALRLLEKQHDYDTAIKMVKDFLEHTRSDLDRGWATDELIRLEKRQ
jgi:type IV pilus biogenesis/stability protein PilW